MKYVFAILVFLTPALIHAQPCKLLTDIFAAADTMQFRDDQVTHFRFTPKQLDDFQKFPGLDKAIPLIRKIQKTLDEDYDSFLRGILWQLDSKLSQKQLGELKTECPETNFKALEKEIEFYRSRFKAKTP